MKILITGIYGNVGSFLAEKLIKNNYIIGVGKRDKYNGCNEYYTCDITDKGELENIIKNNSDIDIIIHSAALAHNKGDDLSKDKFMKVNYEASKYLVDLSNEHLKLKNFIFTSTISVYGEKIDKDVYYEEDQCHPKSPYAVAKKKSEEYIIGNCKSNYTILRLGPVYSKDFKLNIERRSIIRNISYKVGDGNTKLSLCNIKNIYEAINYIIENNEKEINEIYNIVDNTIYGFNNLLEFMGVKAKVTIPRFALSALFKLNKLTINKQFIEENSIKLITDNIYSSNKIDSKISMKYSLRDV